LKLLPVEWNDEICTYQLIVDLRVVGEMHIKVPQDLVYRADEVIQ